MNIPYEGPLRDRKYEYVIGQVDVATGEIIWPKQTKSRIQFLRKQSGERIFGCITIVTLLSLLIFDAWNNVSAKSPPKLESIPIRRTAAVRDTAAIYPERIVRDIPTAPRIEIVRVGGVVKSRRSLDGTIVIYSKNVYETRVVSNRSVRDTALDLNTASVEELDRILPGVGPVMAKAIVAARPFRSVKDLHKIPRVGPVTFARLERLVVVR